MEKKCGIFIVKRLLFQIFWTSFGLDLKFEKVFGLCLDLYRVLSNQDWIWIAKYDIPLISGMRPRLLLSLRTEEPHAPTQGNALSSVIVDPTDN